MLEKPQRCKFLREQTDDKYFVTNTQNKQSANSFNSPWADQLSRHSWDDWRDLPGPLAPSQCCREGIPSDNRPSTRAAALAANPEPYWPCCFDPDCAAAILYKPKITNMWSAIIFSILFIWKTHHLCQQKRTIQFSVSQHTSICLISVSLALLVFSVGLSDCLSVRLGEDNFLLSELVNMVSMENGEWPALWCPVLLSSPLCGFRFTHDWKENSSMCDTDSGLKRQGSAFCRTGKCFTASGNTRQGVYSRICSQVSPHLQCNFRLLWLRSHRRKIQTWRKWRHDPCDTLWRKQCRLQHHPPFYTCDNDTCNTQVSWHQKHVSNCQNGL